MTLRLRPASSPIWLGMLGLAATACGGGAPLLHPARTLPKGEVRVAGGMSANVTTGSLSEDLRNARDLATADPTVPGAPGTHAEYAKGALVSAAIGPGLAPVVGGRVGVGGDFEGGLTYTGRAVRVDMRRSFNSGNISYSAGLGLSATLYGRKQGDDLPNVNLTALHGYGGDIPLLIGWESTGGIYKVWGGGRAGFDHYVIEALTSEPRPTPTALNLSADRFWGGGVLGLAVGLGHVHVGTELSVAYHVVSGTYNQTSVRVQGLTLAPATALWWTF